MANSKVYYLAKTTRTKLSHEAASNDPNLRRVLGHANMLDHLVAELVNRGYLLDGNEEDIEEEDEENIEDEEECVECMQDLAVAEEKPSCHNGRANLVTNDARDDLNSEFFESSNCELSDDELSDDEISDDEVLEDEKSGGHPKFYVTEYFEDGGNGDCLWSEDIKASSRIGTIQISVQELSDGD